MAMRPLAPDPVAWPAALFAVLAGWVAFSWPWLSGVVTIPWDAKAHFYPQAVFLARSLHGGQWPFWAPEIFGGHPQVADPQALLLAPPFLALAALDPKPSLAAFDGAVLATTLVAALAVLAYGRDRGWHPAAGVVAALAVSLGGMMAWRIQHVGQVLSLAHGLVALWLLDRALRRPSLSHGLGAGVVAGLMLVQRDQVAYLGLLLLGAYAAVVFTEGLTPGRALHRLGVLLAGGLGGALVVTVPIALTLALAAESNRPAISLDDAGKGSLHPWSLLTLALPHLFGIARPLAEYWGPPSPDWGDLQLFLARNMATLYLGALPLAAFLLLPLVTWRGERRLIAFWLGAALLFLAYALGRYTPVFGVAFALLPGVDLFRRPADALFWACACLAIGAGFGLDRWLRAERPPLRPFLVLWTALTVALLLAGAALALSFGRLGAAGPALFGGALWLLVAAAVLMALRRIGSPALAALVAGLITAVDLSVSNGPNESTALPRAGLAELDPGRSHETVAALQRLVRERATTPEERPRVELAGLGFHWPNAGMVHGFEHALGYNPMRLRWFADGYGAGDTIAVPDQRVWTPLVPDYAAPLVAAMGTRFIARPPEAPALERRLDPLHFPVVARTVDAVIHENPAALPRLLFVTGVVTADPDRLIREGHWPEMDLRRAVLLPPGTPWVARPAEAMGRVRLLAHSTTTVRVAVSSTHGGHVVLHDIWHPWWEARIDGVPAPVLRANVLFRAVQVPPGEREVVFIFRPFEGAARFWRRRLLGVT